MKKLITLILIACSLSGFSQVYKTVTMALDTGTNVAKLRAGVQTYNLTDTFKNYQQIQDGLISGGSATIGTGSVTIDTAYYRINKANKMSLPRTFTGIANSASGTQYYILVYGKSDNTLDTLYSLQDTISAVPTAPTGTVSINNILVGDGGVVSADPDLSGYALTNGSNASGTWDINITGISGDSYKFNSASYGGSNYSLVPKYIVTYDSLFNKILYSNKIGVKTFLDLSGTNTGDETFSSITSKLGYTPYNPASYPVNSGGETITSVTGRGATTTNPLSIGGTDSFSGNKLTLQGNILYSNYDGQLTISDLANTNKRVGIGYDGTNNFAFIQPFQNTVGLTDLMLSPNGGNLAIGYTSSQSAKFAVNGTGYFNGTVTAPTFIGELTGIISSSTTATTQSANDNSTKVATTSYADAKVQNNLTSSTTIAPSATAVNTGLATRENPLTFTLPLVRSTNTITVNAATTSASGIVSISAQTFAGDKTFQDSTILNNMRFKALAGMGGGALVVDNTGKPSVAVMADRTLSNKLTKTSAYTVTLSDFGANGELVLEVDCTGGAVTITLPSLANMTGVKLTVFKTDSSINAVTISGAVNINGSSTASLATQWASTIITGGTSVYLSK